MTVIISRIYVDLDPLLCHDWSSLEKDTPLSAHNLERAKMSFGHVIRELCHWVAHVLQCHWMAFSHKRLLRWSMQENFVMGPMGQHRKTNGVFPALACLPVQSLTLLEMSTVPHPCPQTSEFDFLFQKGYIPECFAVQTKRTKCKYRFCAALTSHDRIGLGHTFWSI